jgi:hypothetical protein
MPKTTFELINELILALSKLLWPILVFVAVVIFRKEIKAILTRIRKGKILGQELELNDQIDKLENSTEKAANAVPKSIISKPNNDRDETNVLKEFEHNPKIGIMLLSRDIEKEIRIILGSLGLITEKNFIRVQDSFRLLEEKAYLPKYTTESVEIFWDLRNKLIHGKDISNENQLIRVLDIGSTLLRTLKAIPHEINVVYHPGVNIYFDSDCTKLIENVKGVILVTTGANAVEKSYRIYPTTKHYKKGVRVSWEWNLSNIWGEAWYIHPDLGEKKHAWTDSGEFIGRDIDLL